MHNIRDIRRFHNSIVVAKCILIAIICVDTIFQYNKLTALYMLVAGTHFLLKYLKKKNRKYIFLFKYDFKVISHFIMNNSYVTMKFFSKKKDAHCNNRTRVICGNES